MCHTAWHAFMDIAVFILQSMDKAFMGRSCRMFQTLL